MKKVSMIIFTLLFVLISFTYADTFNNTVAFEVNNNTFVFFETDGTVTVVSELYNISKIKYITNGYYDAIFINKNKTIGFINCDINYNIINNKCISINKKSVLINSTAFKRLSIGDVIEIRKIFIRQLKVLLYLKVPKRSI